MEKITSRENAKIKYACRLASSGAFRRSEGKFLAEGRKLCPELCRGAALETLFCTEAALEKCPELAGLPTALRNASESRFSQASCAPPNTSSTRPAWLLPAPSVFASQSQQSSGSGAGSGGKRLVWPKPGPVTGSPPGNATAGCCPQCRRSGFPPGRSWGCAQCRCRRQWSLPSGPGPRCR